MTYKEFRKWCEGNSHTVNETVAYIEAIDLLTKETAVVVSKLKYEDICIKTCVFSLVEKALDLARTFLEEREGKEKYYVSLKIKDMVQNFGYANKDKENGDLFLASKTESGYKTAKFTKTEAEEIMTQLSFEMVEVEDE